MIAAFGAFQPWDAIFSFAYWQPRTSSRAAFPATST